MTNKYKKEIENINRRVYANKNLAELKRIGKKRGLLNVDHYKKSDRNILIERLVKGKQISDENKNVLLEQAKNTGLKVNMSMSKEDILKKISNPELKDLNVKRLRELADKKGVPLRSQMTDKAIIQRLENPTAYYTVESLKRLARSNNIDVRRNISKPELINILGERDLITTTPIKAQESNLWVSVKNIPETLKRVFKKKARNAREAVADFKEYIKNLKKDYITPSRLKKLSRQLERKEKKAEEEKQRIFTPIKDKSALKNFTVQYAIKGDPTYDPITFLYNSGPPMINIMNKNRNIKTRLYLHCLMKRADPDGFTKISRFAFHSIGYKIITESTDINEIYEEMINEIEEEIQKVEQAEGSGWVFVEVESLVLQVDIWDPLKASSYIDLPKELKNKKAIINMKNVDDNKCFLWCVLRALNPKDKNAERIDNDLKSKEHTLNMSGINYPVDIKKDVDRFERQNLDISISILGYTKEDKIYSLRKSKYKRKHNIILLLIKNGDNSHYCLVKNLSALLSSQINKRKSKFYFCLNCLNGYDNPEKLEIHNLYCSEKETVKINMPPPDTYLKFNNFHYSERAPFTIYADYECILKPMDTYETDLNKSYTMKYQEHKPVSFTYYIKSFNESVYKSKLKFYVKEKEEDPDPVDIFINWLEEDVKKISKLGNQKMVITEKEQEQFNQASDCWICGKKLNLEDRVRDHCHYTGRYRGAAHNKCNLKYSKPNNISVFFHNLAGYDSHLFIKKLGVTEGYIDCIPNNEENYISFSKTIKTGEYINKSGETKNKYFKIIFKDSMKFLNSSVEALVNNLPNDGFKNLEKHFKPEHVKLLKQKGFFPYDYMDKIEKLKDTKPPPQEAFYSKLSGKGINKSCYGHVLNVWKSFNMKTFKDYLKLYNISDVLLLADVFENFRDICLKNYGLDPVYYYTAPGLAWDAMLKMTKINLELLNDVDMLLMFEKGIRGGISIISNRYGKANNKYMADFNQMKPSKHLFYVDANNLYGDAMSQKLPIHSFKWLTNKEIENLYNNQIGQVWKKTPCILEVDLEYPEELHDLHNDYPLCPERVECDKGVNKLIPNLRDKNNYVIHYKNLMQCLKLGMKLKKIHRGIKFIESDFMKLYIDTNTKLRTQAKNNFEKDFFKLMNNATFGKAMENIRNRVNVKLVSTGEQFKKLTAKPNYDSRKILSENLVSVHMKKTSLTMNKPVYLGMCILDLSKIIMYDFHYNYIKPKYGNKAKLLFTDTDSFLYEIETEDLYNDISGDVKDRFDTSNYPENHPSGIPTGINNKVLGKFKDEAAGKPINEFVGLRSKLYSYKMDEGKENKRCKGIKKAVVEKSIRHEDYKNCLETGKEQLRRQNIIRSYEHVLYTEEINKIALSSADDKRYLLKDSFDTLAWGHYKIKDMDN